MPFILGVAVLILLLWAANGFSKASPKQAAIVVRKLGGIGALIFAVFLLVRGEFGVAIPFGVFGLGLLGWAASWPPSIRNLFTANPDRGNAGRGENAQGDAAAGSRRRSAASGKMTEEEAYQILDIEPGASADDITRAHRTL